MSYTDIWTSANDTAFQGRCWAALWDVANRVVAEESGYPATGQVDAVEDIPYAFRILRDKPRLTARQLSQQVLRNATIAANPGTSTDADILYQINANVWADLREIG